MLWLLVILFPLLLFLLILQLDRLPVHLRLSYRRRPLHLCLLGSFLLRRPTFRHYLLHSRLESGLAGLIDTLHGRRRLLLDGGGLVALAGHRDIILGAGRIVPQLAPGIHHVPVLLVRDDGALVGTVLALSPQRLPDFRALLRAPCVYAGLRVAVAQLPVRWGVGILSAFLGALLVVRRPTGVALLLIAARLGRPLVASLPGPPMVPEPPSGTLVEPVLPPIPTAVLQVASRVVHPVRLEVGPVKVPARVAGPVATLVVPLSLAVHVSLRGVLVMATLRFVGAEVVVPRRGVLGGGLLEVPMLRRARGRARQSLGVGLLGLLLGRVWRL